MIVEAIQGDALAADQGCQTIAIQVMGNMAAGEDVDLGSRDEDETVSAVIFREGGAHVILDAARANLDDNASLFCALEALNYVCQDAKTAGKLNDAGLVDLTLDTMRQWEDDVEIVERAFDLFYTLCFAPQCAEVCCNFAIAFVGLTLAAFVARACHLPPPSIRAARAFCCMYLTYARAHSPPPPLARMHR